MKTIHLDAISGAIICDNYAAGAISQEIKMVLLKEHVVEVNFGGIKAMTTYSAKQIFGELYLSLGASDFFEMVYLKNANDNIKKIIKLGIQDAIEDRNRVAPV